MKSPLLLDGKKDKKIKKNKKIAEKEAENVYIFTDKRCLLHKVSKKNEGEEFDERPERLLELMAMIEKKNWKKICKYIDQLEYEVPKVEQH
ncbi:hypothetical protein RFI_13227 [Reticulomyxa filosa]|uniref:Uncharacterized protein n=1 Tax=Reticulomyxa filosa TaxID=46433 RepID=X6NDX3_RETFI|nr:hypothetical protein RFI_13227 [Reticulomyxa filosa]|eukprot:ETO23929.1 hypothetical protein RFI_13227 [Reticulomyxa filosa]